MKKRSQKGRVKNKIEIEKEKEERYKKEDNL